MLCNLTIVIIITHFTLQCLRSHASLQENSVKKTRIQLWRLVVKLSTEIFCFFRYTTDFVRLLQKENISQERTINLRHQIWGKWWFLIIYISLHEEVHFSSGLVNSRTLLNLLQRNVFSSILELPWLERICFRSHGLILRSWSAWYDRQGKMITSASYRRHGRFCSCYVGTWISEPWLGLK